jgi:dihydroxy-acid dehydratase
VAEGGARRSDAWLAQEGVAGLLHRGTLRASLGVASAVGRPVIGICNSWSELVHCNVHFRSLAAAVKRGVLEAGGLPVEFPTISLSENLMKPTTMLYRNLMAMDVEESIRSQPFDAVVLIGGCDKTVPAQLMGAASAGVPAIMLTGGPSLAGTFRGRKIGVGYDLWRATDEYRAGTMSAVEYAAFEGALMPSAGHCNEMGTASTMAAICEALGMSLGGSALATSVSRRRLELAELSGKRAVELAGEGLAPADVLTEAAFGNAIAVLMAIGGATNAVIHLLALAGRVGVPLRLDHFERIAKRTPVLVNVAPAGEHLVEDLDAAGGIPALMHGLREQLDLDAVTVSGRPIGSQLEEPRVTGKDVIATVEDPIQPAGGVVVLRGNLAPRGALIKRAAASARLLRHRGSAHVFESIEELAETIDDPLLELGPDSVLVLRNAGPVGAPGMPEWGMLPIPRRLLENGVTDLVRISDARMSGTAYGTVIVHVTPEAAVGGPLAAVRTGDVIDLDVERGELRLEASDEEIAGRLARAEPSATRSRGYAAMYREHVLQADEGCDFDFLRADTGKPAVELPRGLATGWVGGW